MLLKLSHANNTYCFKVVIEHFRPFVMIDAADNLMWKHDMLLQGGDLRALLPDARICLGFCQTLVGGLSAASRTKQNAAKGQAHQTLTPRMFLFLFWCRCVLRIGHMKFMNMNHTLQSHKTHQTHEYASKSLEVGSWHELTPGLSIDPVLESSLTAPSMSTKEPMPQIQDLWPDWVGALVV